MRILNCKSVDDTVRCLARILDVPELELRARRLRHDHKALAELYSGGLDYESLVEKQALLHAAPATPPDEVVWYHATRVPRSVNFKEQGLLPLGLSIARLRQEMRDSARELGISTEERYASSSYVSKIQYMPRWTTKGHPRRSSGKRRSPRRGSTETSSSRPKSSKTWRQQWAALKDEPIY